MMSWTSPIPPSGIGKLRRWEPVSQGKRNQTLVTWSKLEPSWEKDNSVDEWREAGISCKGTKYLHRRLPQFFSSSSPMRSTQTIFAIPGILWCFLPNILQFFSYWSRNVQWGAHYVFTGSLIFLYLFNKVRAGNSIQMEFRFSLLFLWIHSSYGQ